MHRIVWSVVFLSAALGAVFLLVFRASDSVGGEIGLGTDRGAIALEALEAKAEPALEAAEGIESERLEWTDDEPAPEVEGATGYPRSRVFGKVTDVRGAPLEGALVAMRSVNGRWVSRELHPDDLPDFETMTDAAGAFEFDAPFPTSDWISLIVRPSSFHMLAGRNFGPAGGRDEEPLRRGDNDLGTFVLADAGAFEGKVVGVDGTPIPGSRVRLDGSFPGGYSVGAYSEDDGAYRVGGVPEGQHAVKASAKGFTSRRILLIKVKHGEVTTGIDFRLERAASIAGRVVDKGGNPLAKVRVHGWPSSSGQGASARTAADGTFTMFLPQNEPYTLSAELPGYEKFDTGHGKHFPPGTTDLEVVLRRPELTTYRVLDGETGEPVERFGLRIFTVRTERGATSPSSPREGADVADHPGGEVELPGDPRYNDYTIVAPGYGRRRGRVEHDEPGGPRQTIRLSPGGVITGRFVSGATALANPTLRIKADRIPLKPGAEGEDDIFSKDWGTDLDDFAGAKRQHRGNEAGAFRIEDLAAGTYELLLSAPGVGPLLVERVQVEAGRTTELGDLEAHAPSAIHGTIVLPGGLSRAGLRVALGDEHFARRQEDQITDATGRFTIEGLAEGKHYIHVRELAGRVVRGAPTEVDLGRGEVREVQLDLSDRVPCEVEVHVRIQGEAAEGAIVSTRHSSDRLGKGERLGLTNEVGVAVGYVSGQGEVVLDVMGSGGLLVGVSAASVNLATGGRERVDISFDAGRLSVALTEELGDTGGIPVQFLNILRLDALDWRQSVRLTPADWKSVSGEPHADLGWIAPGTYAVHLSAGTKLFKGEVRVSKGESALCTLAPE